MVSRARRGGLATARKKKKMVVERAKYLGIKVPKRITSKYRKKVHSAFYRELKKQKATVTKVRKGWKRYRYHTGWYRLPGVVRYDPDEIPCDIEVQGRHPRYGI